MRNYTFNRTFLSIPIFLLVLFSSIAFGQKKQAALPSVSITFRVDMTYQVAKEAFNPLLDFVDIAGTMNGWDGSDHMSVVGSSMVYEITYTLDSNTIQEYKFRINGVWATSEFPNGGPNRLYLVPNHPDTAIRVFNDYDPGTVPATFKCHMSYQIKMGRFDKAKDYLDFAGSINQWGNYDVLFDRGNDSTYEFNINIDTDYVVNLTKIEYKYRINGDKNNSEFPDDGSFRVCRVNDTAGGVKNVIEVWYKDQDPTILSPPFAYNLSIQGNFTVGEPHTGVYTYEDVNGDQEGISIYAWLRADSVTQINPDTISGASAVNYVPTADDVGKYLAFVVTPVALSGTYLIGFPVIKWTGHKVYGVGINETDRNQVRFYPNPVSDFITIENINDIEKIEIFSVLGKRVFSISKTATGKITLNTANLESGVYFIKFYKHDMSVITSKFIKN